MGGRTMVVCRAWITVLAMACTVGVACDEASDAPDADIEARALELNGLVLNGFRLNGFRLNGFRLNGFRLNGDPLAGEYIELKSIDLSSGGRVVHSWLEGSDLHVETNTGQVLSGAELVGAVLHFEVGEAPVDPPSTRKIKIGGVAPLPSDPAVLRYDLLFKEATGPWKPLCTDDVGNQIGAILIGEAWDPGTASRIAPHPTGAVTMACRDGALAKCVEWGYYPWEHADYHQACTRAARADYCGDGLPHTLQGLLIHVLDELGIQEAEPNVTYEVEAEWGPDGATCVNPEWRRLSGLPLECERPTCGEPFASGGLIQTGVLPI